MTRTWAVAAVLGIAAATAGQASASTVGVVFSGPGVSGSLQLTYGATRDAKYPNALEVTGITGIFSDSNNGLNIVNSSIGGPVDINHATPESTNLLAPHDFSQFAVASGLPAENHGFLTYDNLFWPLPLGSPQTASDYPPHGGFLDIYGLMFVIAGGQVVDLWSNGSGPGGPADYGVAVATAADALDYVAGGVVAFAPEPGSLWLLASGLLGLLVWRGPRPAARLSAAT